MNPIFKKYYWLFVSIGIILNIIIFIVASQKLEEYVAGDLISRQGVNEV